MIHTGWNFIFWRLDQYMIIKFITFYYTAITGLPPTINIFDDTVYIIFPKKNTLNAASTLSSIVKIWPGDFKQRGYQSETSLAKEIA